MDPSLGDDDSFQALVDAARELDIRIILDGVFSHTGADSRYFNRLGNYDTVAPARARTPPITNGIASVIGRTTTSAGGE